MLRIDGQVRAMRPDISALLSASAGSGKTHVLVRRVIHLLACGAEPESLAAVTFTEKAAAQMKDKLFHELFKAARAGTGVRELLGLEPSDMPYPVRKDPEEILSGLASCPDCLKVSTIHAFCLGLLRAFPIEASLPADFKVMDGSEIPIRRESAVDACIDSLTGDEEEARLAALSDAGLTLREVRALLLLALGKRSQISRLGMDHGGMDRLSEHILKAYNAAGKEEAAKGLLRGIQESGLARELARMLAENGVDEPEAVEGLMRLDGLSGLAGLPDAFLRLSGYFFTKKMDDRKDSPLSGTRAEKAVKATHATLKGAAIKEKARLLKEEHGRIYFSLRAGIRRLAGLSDEVMAARALAGFLMIYGKAEGMYTETNTREGLVDYDDLELHAYMLLTRPDAQSLLARMEQKVAHYLIDEFQDTGELQWGILRRLNAETFAGQGAEGPLWPTLFAVGDKKQSIYRFRKANYRLMDKLRAEMELSVLPDRRDFPELHHNFRSSPEVLRVVDETFGALLGEEYKKAQVVRKEAKGSVRLTVVRRDKEADALAGAVRSALGLPVWDDEKKEFRPASYGDMAVLLRARTGLASYEEALKGSGIPFKVVGGVGFFYQEEIRALVGLLNYLADPGDFISLAAALKSPLFRLADPDIEKMLASGAPLDALADIHPDAARLIGRWRGMAGLVTAGRLVEAVVRDSAALFSFGIQVGAAAVLNVEKLVGLAREFDQHGGVGLSHFTEWASAYREKSELASADVELPQYRDFVSVMTVHAAKGLEFPVVFMPGMARATKNGVEPLLISDLGEDGTALGLRTDALMGDNPAYAALREEEANERVGESRRLLYVGMTRARDHLVMLAGVKTDEDGAFKPPAGTWLSLISDAAPESLLGEGPALGTSLTEYAYYPEKPVIQEEKAAGSEKAEEGLDLPPISRLLPLPCPEGIAFRSPSSPAWKEGPVRDAVPGQPGPYSARLRGVLLHAAIERFGRDGRLDVEAAAGGLAGMSGLDRKTALALTEDVGRTLSGLLSDPAIRELLSPGEGKRFELPLMLMRGRELKYGKADLVIIDGDTARVYDFKTGMGGLTDEEVVEMYSPQLADYCDAAKEALGLRLCEGFLLLADNGRLLPLTPKNL